MTLYFITQNIRHPAAPVLFKTRMWTLSAHSFKSTSISKNEMSDLFLENLVLLSGNLETIKITAFRFENATFHLCALHYQEQSVPNQIIWFCFVIYVLRRKGGGLVIILYTRPRDLRRF